MESFPKRSLIKNKNEQIWYDEDLANQILEIILMKIIFLRLWDWLSHTLKMQNLLGFGAGPCCYLRRKSPLWNTQTLEKKARCVLVGWVICC